MDYSNEQLIVNYLKGDEKSLEILIENHLKPIYGFVYRYVNNSQEAEDITQEVFLRTWRNLKKFNHKKGNFKTWIFTIARNAALDFLKKKKVASFSDFVNEEGESALVETLADPNPLLNEILERAEDAKNFNLILGKLPVAYQTLLSFYYNEQFNFREIAEVLNEPINTIKSRHRRAILMLRKLL